MAERLPTTDDRDDGSAKPTDGRPPGMPRWLKVSGVIVIGLILLLVVLQLAGIGGGHGPRRHGGASRVAETAVETAVAAETFAFDPSEITVALGQEGTLIVEAGGHAPPGSGHR